MLLQKSTVIWDSSQQRFENNFNSSKPDDTWTWRWLRTRASLVESDLRQYAEKDIPIKRYEFTYKRSLFTNIKVKKSLTD